VENTIGNPTKHSNAIRTKLRDDLEIDLRQRPLNRSEMIQAVWKRFSYPNNSKQPGVMDLDATV